MELSVLMTILILGMHQITAKTSPVIVSHDGKTRHSQKQNAVSTTAKPETRYQIVQKYVQRAQPEKTPSHYTQSVAAVPQQLQQVTVQPFQLHQQVVPIQTQLHPQSQQQLLQLIQRVLYSTQQNNQPTAMIIIAQPTYIPANVVYGNAAQQLLNYPQARFQYSPVTSHTQTLQHYVPQTQAVQVTQPIQSYPILPAPAQYQTKMVQLPTSQTTHMSPVQTAEAYSQQVPLQLSQIAQMTQLSAQQYYPQSQYVQAQVQGQMQTQAQAQLQVEPKENQVEYPSSIPPIITGFENFTPEQQEKIKAQLSAHFGAPLKPLNIGRKDNKYQLNTDEFIPSPQVKTERSSNVMSISKDVK
ncbi:uncharacterized protein LOC114348999 [Diabrotica virgifera virgifera]|uniref:Uncharacterized protein n=1 Tax=Diabrotica virgifera virgifera TaxID=50390 RepID=A0ABM5J045_DIAVI|nr:uncharacterized protein LOC114348999 [Diabrotica virgifera virgifera]